jgi:hypothetical protein
VLSELWFPLWASLRLVFGYSCWEYLNHVGLWFAGDLGLGGWEGLGGVWLGCEKGGYGYEACCDYAQVVSFRLSDI